MAGNRRVREEYRENQDIILYQETEESHKRKRRPPIRNEDFLWE
jgi:hypothetical protein